MPASSNRLFTVGTTVPSIASSGGSTQLVQMKHALIIGTGQRFVNTQTSTGCKCCHDGAVRWSAEFFDALVHLRMGARAINNVRWVAWYSSGRRRGSGGSGREAFLLHVLVIF